VNIWSQITLQLVLEKDYLDQLQRIYKHEEGERDITQATIDSITNAFNNGDADELLAQLLGQGSSQYQDIDNSNATILSAILLDDYLQSILREA
jgi:hypothetical protein